MLWMLLAYVLVAGWMAIRSDGVDQDDELLHYMMARAGWQEPAVMLNMWGRPGCTVMYAAVARIGSPATGFMACRLLSVGLFALTAWATWQTARRLRMPYAPFAAGALLGMPLCFRLSYTPMTEIPAAFYAGLGLLLLAAGRRWAAAAVFALLPVTRHEMVALVAPLAIYFLWRRDVVAALLLGWGEAAWNLLSRLAHMPMPWTRFLLRGDSSALGSGHAFTYVARWLDMSGPVLAGLMLTGTIIVLVHQWRRWRGMAALVRPSSTARQRRLRLCVVAMAGGLLVLQSLLYIFNRFASGGYARFLIPAAPAMALCAAWGVGPLLGLLRGRPTHPRWAFVPMAALSIGGAIVLVVEPSITSRLPARAWFVLGGVALAVALHPRALTARVVLTVLLVLGTIELIVEVRPHPLHAHQKLLAETVAEMRRDYPGCRIVGHNPWVSYFTGQLPTAHDISAQDQWRAAEGGDLLFFYDLSHAYATPLATIEAYPNQLVRTRHCSSTGLESKGPYLRVFRRLPGGALSGDGGGTRESRP